MKKFNLQELSHQDRARVRQFCRIIATGWLRLEEEEARKAAEANKPKEYEKISREVDLMPNSQELLRQISTGEKTLNQAREELGLEPIEDERCTELMTKSPARDDDALHALLDEYDKLSGEIVCSIISELKKDCCTYAELEKRLDRFRQGVCWQLETRNKVTPLLDKIKRYIEKEKSDLPIPTQVR